MRLIDADALGVTDFELALCDGDYKELCKTLIAKVESAPTIDAEPVVRCKNCSFSETPIYNGSYYWCNRFDECMDWDFFCACGQRREDGDA